MAASAGEADAVNMGWERLASAVERADWPTVLAPIVSLRKEELA